jgi:CheY-like chemotaxis protein
MIDIVLDLPDDEVSVLADKTQLEMAVLNLAINARDAMPEGGTIAISAEVARLPADPELAAGDYVLMRLKDGGTGMQPDVARRAFEPFFTTKGVGKGTGLGLSQVYGMARQSGGTVRLASAPGQGTTVTLYLRRALERGGETPLQISAPGSDAGRARVTILVVDDDDDVRRWLVTAVDTLGYRVVGAADGPSGLLALDAGADLLLVDYAMPGMTGADVARAARARRPDLPIIFATGYADTEALDGAVGPAALVLRKPFEVNELEAAIAAALGSSSRRLVGERG